jgi:hypothetical protein
MATIVNSLPAQIDYEIWQGDTWFPGTITAKVNNVAIDFTGHSAKMEIRNAISKALVLTLTSDPSGGIVLTDDGIITLSMTAAQTNDLTGEYSYDLQIIYPNGNVRTYTWGTLTVLTDTTAN